MSSPPSTASRIRGSLFGVAVCDALGGPVEFCRRGTFPTVTGFQYNGNFDLPPGSWTDDTSMTLCLAQSLIDAKGGFVLLDQVKKYASWVEEGYMSSTGTCFDVGNATRSALTIWRDTFRKYSEEGVMEKGQAFIDKALKKKVQCGNGSLMRVSPIGLVYHNDLDSATQKAALSSQVTHPYPTNAEACQLYTKLIVLAMRGAPKSELASAVALWPFNDSDLHSRLVKYSTLDSWAAVPEMDISSSGYVVHSLEASLWAFFTSASFQGGALKVVNLGNDADTVGAIYGGIAGAFHGIESIPQEWIQGLEARALVERVVEGVVAMIDI